VMGLSRCFKGSARLVVVDFVVGLCLCVFVVLFLLLATSDLARIELV